ncbi:MAG: hypothetical protein HYS22_07740 [Deltaproteobacteria bacterium]|nr:hypothetical protein [Deltaproteobacteria bacterium]
MRLFPAAFLATLLITPPLWALPRYAVQEGVGCVSCHVNPTGAGKRNDTGGFLFARKLSLKSTRVIHPGDLVPLDLPNGRLNKFAAIGADFRVHDTTTLGTVNTNNIQIPQGSLYLELNAGQHLTAYADYDLANTASRELFGMVHQLPAGLYFKVGRINLPYGLRVDDDSSPIRTSFNATFANQDIGGEIGIAPGPLEIITAVSNGVPGGTNDENAAKAITTTVQWVGKRGRVGSSFQFNKRSTTRLISTGLHGGFTLGPLIGLGEVDLQQNHPNSTTTSNAWVIAGYSELDWKVIDGLSLKTVYDYLDPNYLVGGDLQHRIGFGIDLYPLSYSQISVLYRANLGTGPLGDDQILLKMHFFF